MKEKVAKQLNKNKNKELLAEAVVDTLVDEVEGASKTVLDAMKLAPIVWMSWGGKTKSFWTFFCF